MSHSPTPLILSLIPLGLIALGLIALFLISLFLRILPWIRNLRERRSAGNRGDDLEMQETTAPATRQSYDSAQDGFVQMPVYGGGTGRDASLVSFASFVEADIAERRSGSLDTLAGMEDLMSPKTKPASDNFLDAGVGPEGDGGRVEEDVGYIIGEDEPEGAACEGEPEGVKADFKEGATSPVSPVGLGISGGLDIREDEIQAQLEMLEGRSSAEKIWSCEVVEAFEGV